MAVLRSIQDKEGHIGLKKSARLSATAFHCSQCSATFNRSAHLRRHQTAHQGEKPYACQYCSVSSSRKDVIIRHTRNFHPESMSQKGCENNQQAEYHEHGRAGYSSMSPSTFNNPCTQGSAGTVTTRNLAQEPVGGDASSTKPSQAPNSHTDDQNGALQTNTRGSVDQDMYANDLSFLNEANLPDDDMLGFLPSHQPADLSLWHLLEPGINLPSLPAVYQDNFQVSPIPPPNNISSSGESDTQQIDSPFLIHDAEYSEAQANLVKFDQFQRLSDFQLPSKFAMTRFVKAFFEHMTPHLPIIHRPTFDLASVPCPLLLEILACGALYSSEQETAARMHIAAMRLMSEADDISLLGTKENKFQLWELQTNLLLSYFGAHGQNSEVRQRALNTFSLTTELAKEGIKAVNSSEATTYKDWVYQETISRCVASVGILGAVLNSMTQGQSFSLPNFEAKSRLPSNATDWLRDEQSWDGPPIVVYLSDVVTCVLAGQRPEIQAGNFAFLTIVSAMLSHICSFEALASSRHPELYATFINKMSDPVQLLDNMWSEQAPSKTSDPALPLPLIQCTRSLLDSTFYHLYASEQLKSMKRLLRSPELLNNSEEVQKLLEQPHSNSLGTALFRAATALRFDCRLGLKYVQKMAPHRFGPLSTTALTEGSLLLYWYFRYGRSTTSAVKQYPHVDAVMTEVTAELESLQMTRATQFALLPLVASAELLQESSVWQWPPNESAKFRSLIASDESVGCGGSLTGRYGL